MSHAQWPVVDEKLSQEQQRFYMEVGRRIRDARHRQVPRLTQDALAKMVGLTRTSITNVEHGRQKCLLHTLADIATALHVAAGSLLPAPNVAAVNLDGALRGRPQSEQNWIISAVTASQNGNTKNGS